MDIQSQSFSHIHTDIFTSDWMRCVVVVENKFIHSLEQSATSYVHLKTKYQLMIILLMQKLNLRQIPLTFDSEQYPKIHLQ